MKKPTIKNQINLISGVFLGLLLVFSLLLFSIIFSGCTKQEILNNDQLENKTEPIVGGDKDSHGCIGSAGYLWCEEKQKCLRPWEENCTTQIVVENKNKHICTQQESLNIACTMDYNPVCGEIVLNAGQITYQTFGNGCSACAAMKVVSYTQGECLPDKPLDTCSDQKGNYLTLTEAINIAKSSECGNNLIVSCNCPEGYSQNGQYCNPNCYNSVPQCELPSTQCEKTYFCNEGTGTYWIDLNLTKTGCNPACVVNVEDRTAEINWRCTGLGN